jgi:hypothetical protein
MRPLFSILLPLVSVASAYSGDRVPTVYLNHFAVVIEQASYDALRSSPEIAALAKVDEAHVVAGSRNWTGFYITGRQTYIELFGAAMAPEGQRLGDSQFNLSVEQAGGVAAIAARLRTVFGTKVAVTSTPRTTPTGEIPWMKLASVSGPGVMGTSIIEVDAGYLAAMHPGTNIEHPLSREQYNMWRFLPDHTLDDVVSVTAALNPTEMAELATEIELVGWAVQRGTGGFVAVGPDVKLTVVPAGARAGIQQADLRLRHSVPKQVITLGSAKLLLEGETGRFIFWTQN